MYDAGPNSAVSTIPRVMTVAVVAAIVVTVAEEAEVVVAVPI